MFRTPCDLAKYLESLTGNVLDLERSSKIWKVRETSITDFIIANFMSHSFCPWVAVDGSNEATTNADFEVIFRTGGQDLTLLIQAKRSYISKSKSVSFPELFHPKTSGSQNLALIKYAARMNMLPLYSFYLSSAATGILTTKLPGHTNHGIMLNGAKAVRSIGFKRSTNKRNILQANSILHGAFPFHSLFCIAQSTRSLETIASLALNLPTALETLGTPTSLESADTDESDEILEVDLNKIIRPSSSLEERRALDGAARDYRDGPYTSFQTFRVLVDLDQLDGAT